MKKTILLFFSFLLAGNLFSADYNVDDFESGNLGWTTVDCYHDIRSNAFKNGINTSDNVLFTNRGVANNNWAGAIRTLAAPVTGYSYLHIKMYRNNTNQPNVKVSENVGTNGLGPDLTPLNEVVANQWQDLVFDVSGYSAAGVGFVMLMVDRSATLSEEAWMLVDDIVLNNDPTPRSNEPTPVFDESGSGETNGYQLVWQDLFNNGVFNSKAWNIEENADGGGNNELQYYRSQNVSVGTEPATGRGCLILTAKKETYGGKPATSGRINSSGKMMPKYGKIEASIKLPYSANGLWPAFWMLGNDNEIVGWPACGEIDILEMGHINGINAGTQDRYFNGACHWGPSYNNGAYPNYAVSTTNPYSIQGDFQLFTLVWDATSVKMYLNLDKNPSAAPYYQMAIDGKADASSPGYFFHKEFFVIFNLAVGGSFPQIYDINNVTALNSGSAKMYIDYVKVYQKGIAGESITLPLGTGNDAVENNQHYFVYPNPTKDVLNINQEMDEIQVYSVLGKLMIQEKNTSTVDLSSLPQGVYCVTLTTENGLKETKRIIKE